MKKKNRQAKLQTTKISETAPKTPALKEDEKPQKHNAENPSSPKEADIIDKIKPKIKKYAGLATRQKTLFITIAVCMAVLSVIICIIMTPSGRKSSYKNTNQMISAPKKPKFIPPPPVKKQEEQKSEMTAEDFCDSIILLLSKRAFNQASSLMAAPSERQMAIPLEKETGFEDRSSIFGDGQGLEVYFGKTNAIYQENTAKLIKEEEKSQGKLKIKAAIVETSFIESGNWNESSKDVLNRQVCRLSLIKTKDSWKIARIETKNEIPEEGSVDKKKLQGYGYTKAEEAAYKPEEKSEDIGQTDNADTQNGAPQAAAREEAVISEQTYQPSASAANAKKEAPQIILPQEKAPEIKNEAVEGNETGTAGGSVE